MKQTLLSAIKKSSSHLMKNYGKIRYVKEKHKESYFTNVDLESEKIIITEIKKKFSDHTIISEEAGDNSKKSDYCWYIDPIDGTHNYIQGFPLFGVSIGLAYKGKIILGAISLPVFKEILVAERSKGAFCNGKRIHVSKKTDAKRAFITTDLTLRLNWEKKIWLLNKIGGNVYDMRAIGCAVASYAFVAKGVSDALLSQQMKPWDVAAGSLLVEEAGGKVTDFSGNDFSLDQKTFLASNGKIHGQLLKLLE